MTDLFFPAENVGAGGSDLHGSNLEKDCVVGAFHPKVANLVHDLVVPWIRNQDPNLSILTSLKVKVTNEINLRTTFSRSFFFWGDLWWSYLEINAFSLQSS